MGRGFFYFRFMVDAHEGSTSALSDGEFRLLTRVWALARRSERPGFVFAAPGVGFDAKTLAAGAHMKAGKPAAALERLVQLGFVRRHAGDVLEVVDWERFNPPAPPSRAPEAEAQRKRDARARTRGTDTEAHPQDGPHERPQGVRSGQPSDGERKANGIRSNVRNLPPHTPPSETEKDLDLEPETTAAAERASARVRRGSDELGPEDGGAAGGPPPPSPPAASGPGLSPDRRLPPSTAAGDAPARAPGAPPSAGPPALPTGAGEGGPPRRRARASCGDDDAPPPRPFLLVDRTELGPLGAELRGLVELDLGGLASLGPDDADLREELEARLGGAGEGAVEAAAAWLIGRARRAKASGGPAPGSVAYLVKQLRSWPGVPGPWERVLEVARRDVQPRVVELLEKARGRLAGGELVLEPVNGSDAPLALLAEHHQADLVALAERALGQAVVVRFELPAAPARGT